ncbi:related to aminotransferase [Colletotrichum tofieldiae]|nr:related to aminotransferase [Colletotrichum tofieldiae]GKT76882.1 related to aminotransferase [Colletotrichum tofieldiae]
MYCELLLKTVLDSVPLSGDAIVWDDFSHASTSLGVKLGAAAHKLSFQHNSVDSLREEVEYSFIIY